MKAVTSESVVFINDGVNHFTVKPLPLEAQFSRVSAVVQMSDSNNKKQFLVAGNFYPYRVQFGHCDASMGLILDTDKNSISAETPYQSGLYLDGDVRNVQLLNSVNHKKYILVFRQAVTEFFKSIKRCERAGNAGRIDHIGR